MSRSKVAAMVGAILLSLAVPAAATSAPPSGGGDVSYPPPSDGGVQYYWLNCPEGTASTGTITENWAESGFLMLRYTVVPCTTPESTTAMAVGFYYPDGHASGTAYPYAPNGLHHIRVPQGARATCLLATFQNRLDCYELLWDSGFVYVGQRLSPADPRVAASPPIELYLVPPNNEDPYCPLCTP
jgi:hypothetical protein